MQPEFDYTPDARGRLARTVVSGAGRGELSVAGTTPGISCVIIDLDGEPLLAVPTDHVAVAAGRAGRLARLDLTSSAAEQVSLAGRLTLANPAQALAEAGDWEGRVIAACLRDGAQLVRFTVETVTLGRADALRRHVVSLDDYAMAEPDLVSAHSPRITEHLNHAHTAQLRHAAAHLLGKTTDGIIGARLADLDAHGVELWGIDDAGAHCIRLVFERPASSVEDLVDVLRAALQDASVRPIANPERQWRGAAS